MERTTILIILISLLTCFDSSAEINIYISNDSLNKIFLNSSYNIAYNYIRSDTNSDYYDDIDLPEVLVKDIYRCLRSVYDNNDPGIDTVYNLLRIYNLSEEEVTGLELFLDTSRFPIKDMIIRQPNTIVSIFNMVIKKYDAGINCLMMDDSNAKQPGIFPPLYEVKLNKPVNVDALALYLSRNVDGLKAIMPETVGGKTNDIKYAVLENGDHKLYYIYGWGDCEMGCIRKHTWEVTLNKNFEVTEIKSYGDNLSTDNDKYYLR